MTNRVSIPPQIESAISEKARETARYMCAVPGHDGSLQFEIHAGGADVEVLISPTGQIVSIMFERFPV